MTAPELYPVAGSTQLGIEGSSLELVVVTVDARESAPDPIRKMIDKKSVEINFVVLAKLIVDISLGLGG